MEVTVKLLENAMHIALKEGRRGGGWANGKGRFLVDGFPRKMDQALKFDEEVQFKFDDMHIICSYPVPGLLGIYGDFFSDDRRSHAQTSS